MRRSSVAAVIRLGIHGSLVEYELFRLAASLLNIRCASVFMPTAGCLLGGSPLSWFPLFVRAPLCTLSPSFLHILAFFFSGDIVIAHFLLCIWSPLSPGLPVPTFFFRSQSLLRGFGLVFFFLIFFTCHTESSMTHVSRFT